MGPGNRDDETPDEFGPERDVTVRLEGGGLYIHDTENRDAWLQSESAVELGRMA